MTSHFSNILYLNILCYRGIESIWRDVPPAPGTLSPLCLETTLLVEPTYLYPHPVFSLLASSKLILRDVPPPPNPGY